MLLFLRGNMDLFFFPQEKKKFLGKNCNIEEKKKPVPKNPNYFKGKNGYFSTRKGILGVKQLYLGIKQWFLRENEQFWGKHGLVFHEKGQNKGGK